MTEPAVLLTGASGFIAKHILLRLMNAGVPVVASVRSAGRANEVRDAVTPLLVRADQGKRLRFVTLDLESDAGWARAMEGVGSVIHTASPFPLTQPRNPTDVIRPAVEGALRALRAAKAAGVGRVVMTSSSVAIMATKTTGGRPLDESDWTDPDHPAVTPYGRSKTLAERAAWDFVRDEAPGLALTTINPAFVLGAPLDRNYGTSIRVIERLLAGRDPMLPHFGFPVVDVGDVAEMHLRALQRPETAGKRYIAADRFVWFEEMARLLAAEFPARRIVTRRAPDIVVRLLSLFDPAIRSIVPILGKREEVSNQRARDEMGMAFMSADEAVRATGRFLVAAGK